MELYIFKTNIRNQEKASELRPLFAQHPEIERWTVDTEDIDKVLRIEAAGQLVEKALVDDLKKAGYDCEELPY